SARPRSPRRRRTRRRATRAVSSRDSEREDGLGRIRLAGTQQRRWELPFVRRVGEVLRLEAEAGAFAVHVTALAGRYIETIPRIELHARLSGLDDERASRLRFDHARGEMHAASAVQHEVVVVAGAVAQLLVVGVDARADR